jgi:hypothetical protein
MQSIEEEFPKEFEIFATQMNKIKGDVRVERIIEILRKRKMNEENISNFLKKMEEAIVECNYVAKFWENNDPRNNYLMLKICGEKFEFYGFL